VMRLLVIRALALAAMLGSGPAFARGDDPDWPCVQRLVPELAAGGVWTGPPAPEGEAWRQASDVAALVARITPRTVPEEEGLRAIAAFSAPLDATARRRLLPLVLAGVLEETNGARSQLIDRIKAFARRQRGLAEAANRTAAALDAIPPDATGEAASRRAELERQYFFEAKAFQDAERTMRYACDAPVRLEARFGAYARALQEASPLE
jgi:hypothetical protein